jgi:hypothetical protein
MLQIFTINPQCQDSLVTNLLWDDPREGLPDLIFTPHSKRPDHRPMRLLAIGHMDDVNSAVSELHARQFADVYGWSQPIPSHYPGEIIRYMTRYYRI